MIKGAIFRSVVRKEFGGGEETLQETWVKRGCEWCVLLWEDKSQLRRQHMQRS